MFFHWHQWLKRLFGIPAARRLKTPAKGLDRRFRPRIEVLEDRTTPAIITVTSLGDQPDPTPLDDVPNDVDLTVPGIQIMLRSAIQAANSSKGPDTIIFDANLFTGKAPPVIFVGSAG